MYKIAKRILLHSHPHRPVIKMSMAGGISHFNLNFKPQIWHQFACSCSTTTTTTSTSTSLSSACAVTAIAVAPATTTTKTKKKKLGQLDGAGAIVAPKIKSVSKTKDELKLNWLSSLSLNDNHLAPNSLESESRWVIGIDPDTSGALALFKPLHSPQVFDTPHLKIMVGKRTRRRLDPKALIQLLQSFQAPNGTVVYLEQSSPYPRDGKLGWWSGGFNYGLWIGALVALGFSVVPVSSLLWKNQFKLSGNGSSKDDSREAASTLFPSISSQLTRKKDHGRAEALLIAAYGMGLTMSPCSPVSQDIDAVNLDC